MASPLTFRLDKQTRHLIARIARRRRLSTSQLIRAAIAEWVERQELTGSPYEAMADLIGVVHGGKPKRSRDSGHQFRELLQKRGRRS